MPRLPRLRRFRDLDAAALNVDYQVHTTRTDGAASIAELLAAARARGLAALAFTEHVRRDTPWFAEFAAAVRQAAQACPDLQIHVGCEAKVLDADGTLDASEAVLAECTLVLGSVHRFPDGQGGYLDFANLGAAACAELEYELALGLLRRAPIHVLAHPGGMTQRRHGCFPRERLRKILDASLDRGIAIEINTSYLRDVRGFLDLCADVNPYVSIGSDVHHLDELGRCRDTLLGLLGFKP
ncbi:MAG TPA: PHP domain-containing protein [Gemmataceae bacterium]|nr:PHP domain-containing protein [Gemmataceae bacterium]